MRIPHNAHVAIADGKRFIVMRNVGQIFDPKLELIAEPDLDEDNYSAGVDHQDEANQRKGGSHTNLHDLARAASAAQWLNRKALANEIDELVVVADPRTLGEMRRHYHKVLQDKIVAELPKELTWESPQAIAQTLAAAE